jgi:hypothetical protein
MSLAIVGGAGAPPYDIKFRVVFFFVNLTESSKSSASDGTL